MAIVYALMVGIFIHRELRLSDLYTIFSESGIVSASVMLIVVCASVFSWVVTTEGIAEGLAEALPLIAAEAAVLLLITYLPGLCLWLPGLMG